MAELVDASDSKSDSARSAGSIPARGTKPFLVVGCYLRAVPRANCSDIGDWRKEARPKQRTKRSDQKSPWQIANTNTGLTGGNHVARCYYYNILVSWDRYIHRHCGDAAKASKDSQE